jgi:hypothetical protein
MISASGFAARIDPTCLAVHEVTKEPTIVRDCRDSEDIVSWPSVNGSIIASGFGVRRQRRQACEAL